MVERVIPRTGERLPVVGLGTWQTFDVGPADYQSRALVLQRFLELGGRLVDSSPMYGRSESAVGAISTQLQARDALFLATKVWLEGRAEGRMQMQASLDKLQTQRVDLMQVHNLLDVEAHLETLAGWKAAGTVRYVGVTHYTVASHRLLEPFLRRGDVDFVQFNYSLGVRAAEERLLPLAAEYGVATLINRPFESGGAFRRVARRPLPAVARDLGCTTWAGLFLKYVISHPAVTCAIPATADVRHLEENMAAGHEPLPDAAQRVEIARAWDQQV